jgi:hemolysin III
MPKRNRRREEFWNVLTHGAGTLLSVAALVLLVVYSAINGTRLHLIASVVFGASLVLLYSASTIYHAMSRLRWKRLFRLIDHLSIYILIAGTYTPIALIGLKGAWGWIIFTMIWIMAVIGFIFKFSPLRRSEKLSLSLYAVMGWLILIAIKPLFQNLSAEALMFILGGGLFYTFGIYFYAKEKIPYNHAIWHLFVLGGSTMHFLGIFFYIIP